MKIEEYKSFTNSPFVHLVDSETETIYDNYFNIRYGIFHNKLKELEIRENLISGIDRYKYLLEFGSINLDFGRQTGSSFFHHYLLNWLTKNKYTSLSLFHSLTSLIRFETIHQPLDYQIYNFIDNIQILKHFPKTIKPMIESLRGVSLDFVIIDVSTLYKTNQIKSLLKAITINQPKMIIHL